MSINYRSINNLKVSEKLLSFVNDELLNGIDIPPETFGQDLTNRYMI